MLWSLVYQSFQLIVSAIKNIKVSKVPFISQGLFHFV